MIEWLRIISVFIGFLISIPAFFIGNTIRWFKVGRRLFHVKTRTIPPACVLDPKYGEHKYMNVNGVKIHYVESGDVNKPLLLFVHGWPQFWFAWRYQIEHFNKNYHVVAIDMRGFNDSDKPSGIQNYFVMNMVNDIKELVTGLGKTSFTLVGHDWGGVISWTFAAFYPQMLDNLVICNLPHPIPFNEARKGLDQALKSWYIIFFQVPILPELNMLADDIRSFDALFKDNPNNDEEVKEAYRFAFKDFKTWNRSINYYRCTTYNRTNEFLGWRGGSDQSRWKIKVRTLHIFGTADTAISVEPAKASAKWVEDYQLELLDGVSHWVQEQEPAKVNSLIENFITSK